MTRFCLDVNKIKYADTLLGIFGFFTFLIFLYHRFAIVNSYGNSFLKETNPGVFYAYRLLWGLETLAFAVYMAAYLFRKPAKELAVGFKQTVFPFIVAAMPFLIIRYSILGKFFPDYGGGFQDLTRLTWQGREMYIVEVGKSPIPLLGVVLIMLTGTLIMIYSLIYLWQSFSIMTEARELVTGGIYKYIRHPLYLGEFISYLGVLCMRFSLTNLMIFTAFVICQSIRAQIEEEKLEEVFPEYKKYIKRTGMFLPKLCISNCRKNKTE